MNILIINLSTLFKGLKNYYKKGGFWVGCVNYVPRKLWKKYYVK